MITTIAIQKNQPTQSLDLFQITLDSCPVGYPTAPKEAYTWRRTLQGSFTGSRVEVRVGMKWGVN